MYIPSSSFPRPLKHVRIPCSRISPRAGLRHLELVPASLVRVDHVGGVPRHVGRGRRARAQRRLPAVGGTVRGRDGGRVGGGRVAVVGPVLRPRPPALRVQDGHQDEARQPK